MSNSLHILINELEAEKSNLLALINDAVKEQEFLSAHYHSEALYQANRQLQTLKNFEDELYDKKRFLENTIENFSKHFNSELPEAMHSYHSKFIEDKKKELDDLHKLPKRLRTGTHQIKNYSEQLIRNKIRGIKIRVDAIKNLLLTISHTKEGIKLSIADIQKLKKEYIVTDNQIRKLKNLGFNLGSKGDKMTIVFKRKDEDVVDRIVKTIAIIFFEAFHHKAPGSEGVIEIVEKRTSTK